MLYLLSFFFQQIKGSLLTPVEASLSVWSVLPVGMKITGFILKGMEKNVNYGLQIEFPKECKNTTIAVQKH